MITDQQWRDLDLLPDNPGKPRYDPWEIFKPTKAFIKEVIKDLNHAAKNNNNQLRELTGNEYDIFAPQILAAQDKLQRRIRDYQWRIKSSGKKNESNGLRITEIEIQRAKDTPSQNRWCVECVRRVARAGALQK